MNKDKQGHPEKCKLRTPLAKQARVTARRMQGQSIRQIATQENISKDTVMRILSKEETSLLIRGYRDTILQDYVPLAMNSLKNLLKREDRQATIETLYGSKVLIDRHEVVEEPEEPVRTYDSTRVLFFGRFARWPLDSELEAFDKTIKRKPTVKGTLQE
jgi:Helix-turn-helix domain of resolvase